MGKFVPALCATLQYAAGITVFRKPETTAGGPMLSCIMVLISVFLLLWSLPIFPRRLRKPIKVLNYITEVKSGLQSYYFYNILLFSVYNRCFLCRNNNGNVLVPFRNCYIVVSTFISSFYERNIVELQYFLLRRLQFYKV